MKANMRLLNCLLFAAVAVSAEEAATEDDVAEETQKGIFTAEQEAAIAGGESKQFQAEVTRLMEIIIHSLYTNREIFIRELISNAGDAIDKIRYKSLMDKSALGDNSEMEIRIKTDKTANTLSIRDFGIGMTSNDLKNNLGVVARSGTAHFLEAIGKTKNEKDSLDLIGQFGVGFYSAFLVADVVTVISKNNDDEQYVWRSKADGNYVVAKDPRGNTLGRGTEVILTLKEDAAEYLEIFEVENVVKRYSEFMQYPIKIWKSETVSEEVPIEEEEKKEDEDEEGDDDELLAEDEDDDEEEKPKTKTVEKTLWDWRQINESKPIWTRRPSEIEESEYSEFWKTFSKGSDDPLAYSHFKAEGEIEFDSVLFIPKKAPYGLYDNYYTSESELKLYVRRVLVADKWKEFLPRYLNFLKGLVDSNDLPLNVNREQLQKNKVMKVISKKVTRKALDLLRQLADAEEDDEDSDDDSDEDDEEKDEEAEKAKEEEKKKNAAKYQNFWKEFGRSIKLGVIEDSKNKKKLLNLLRFKSNKSGETFISLQKYVDNMKDGQKSIYFISASTVEEAAKSPSLERVSALGYEVLYFVDNLDEYMNLSEFDDYQLASITKEGLDLSESKAATKYWEKKGEEFESLKDWLKELYGSKVNKVEVSSRLESTPMTVVTSKWGVSANMERLSKGQAFGRGSQRATKILEINPRHPTIIGLKKSVDEKPDEKKTKDLANLMYDAASITSGFAIEGEDTGDFAARVFRLVNGDLGIAEDAEVEALPEFAADEDEEEEEEDSDDDDDDSEEEEEEEAEEVATEDEKADEKEEL